jgi:hypothetical protein
LRRRAINDIWLYVFCALARITWILLFIAYATLVFGQGGPPLLTDDPGTPGNRNWEINIASMMGFNRGERAVQAPLLDINYGLGDRIQLKYQIAYLWDSDGGAQYRGAVGNSLFGVKWRFYQEDREGGWNVSTYPQVDINNPDDSYARRLVPFGPRFLLPVEVSRTLGPVDVNFEAGYWFNKRAPDERILGLAFGHQFTQRLEGLSEIYDDVFLGGTQRATTFDVGGRYQFHRRLLFLFMAGRSFGNFSGRTSGQPYFIGYFGLQVQLTHGPRKKKPNSSRSVPNP